MPGKILPLILLVGLMTACGIRPQNTPATAALATLPSPTSSPAPTNTTLPSVTPAPTNTSAPIPTSTPLPTATPGPRIAFWYLMDGAMYRYSFQNWASTRIFIKARGKILRAKFSPDRRYLAYIDEEGVKLSESPFDETTLIADTQPEWGGVGLSFSPDYRLLAYNDGEGLKVYDFGSRKISLLIPHYIVKTGDIGDSDDNIYFSPRGWSPDSQWLTVSKVYFEEMRGELYNLRGGSEYQFTDCYSSIVWLPDSTGMAVTVSHSWGILGCGVADGTYIVSVAAGRISDKRIFASQIPDENYIRVFDDLKMSPSGKWLSFVQSTKINHEDISLLYLIRIDGADTQNLATSHDGLSFSIWSNTEDVIYYVEQGTLYRFDANTYEKRQIASLPVEVRLLSMSRDGNWLVFDGQYATWIIGFVNLNTGEVVRTDSRSADFIGWE